MYQKCPICNGQGTVTNNTIATTSSFSNVCTVCNGTKIISTITGKPPL